MTPISVEPCTLKLAGFKIVIRNSISEGNALGQIPVLWKRLFEEIPKLTGRVGSKRYSLITGDLTVRSPQAFYFAMIAVESFDNLPSELEKIDLSDRLLTKFVHKGPPSTVGRTAFGVLHSWIPSSGESIRHNEELCIIGPEYDPSDPQSEFEYCVFT